MASAGPVDTWPRKSIAWDGMGFGVDSECLLKEPPHPFHMEADVLSGGGGPAVLDQIVLEKEEKNGCLVQAPCGFGWEGNSDLASSGAPCALPRLRQLPVNGTAP